MKNNINNRISSWTFKKSGRITINQQYIPDSKEHEHEVIIANIFKKLYNKNIKNSINSCIITNNNEDEKKGIDFWISRKCFKKKYPIQITRAVYGTEHQKKIRDDILDRVGDNDMLNPKPLNCKIDILELNEININSRNKESIAKWIKETIEMLIPVVQKKLHRHKFNKEFPYFVTTHNVKCNDNNCGELNDNELSFTFHYPQIKDTFLISWQPYRKQRKSKTLVKYEFERYGIDWKTISQKLVNYGLAVFINDYAIELLDEIEKDIAKECFHEEFLNLINNGIRFSFFDPIINSIENKVIKFRDNYSKYKESKNLSLIIWGRNDFVSIENGSSGIDTEQGKYLFLEKIKQLNINKFKNIYYINTFLFKNSIGGEIIQLYPEYYDFKKI